MKLEKIRNENRFPILLFFILFLNYIPLFLINYNVKTSNAVNVKEMTICFGIECILLIFFLFKKIKFNKEFKLHFILLIITTICMFGVQIKNYKSGNYEIMDFANIVCIAINIFFLFICLVDIKVDEKYIYNFFKGIICIGILACIVNINLYRDEILGLFGLTKDMRFYSAKSFFAHKNQFAIFLYISIISNMFLLLKSHKKIYIITLILFLANLVFTASRTGILCTCIFIFLFFITTNTIKTKNKIITLLILAILGGIGIIVVYEYAPELIEKIETIFIRKSSIKSFTGRSTIWQVGIDLIMQTPISFIFGVGRFIGVKALDVTEYANITQFHSFYIDMLVTGGIIELLYLLFIYFVVIRRIMKSDIEKKI